MQLRWVTAVDCEDHTKQETKSEGQIKIIFILKSDGIIGLYAALYLCVTVTLVESYTEFKITINIKKGNWLVSGWTTTALCQKV
jgi:hypothetical protein